MAKAPTEIRSLARSHSNAAINALLGVMNQNDAPPAARVSAATAILDRGWGKPAQAIEGGDSAIKVIHKVVREIVRAEDQDGRGL